MSEFRGHIYDSIVDTIGATPLVRFNRIPEAEGCVAEIVGKCEFFNPLGSVKDRIGMAMIEDAERRGVLNKDTVIIEPGVPKNGDIVAALIDGETTLKRLIKQGSKVYLKAENQNYPNLIPTSSLTIQGIAKSVVKPI